MKEVLEKLGYGLFYATRSSYITKPIYSGMGIILAFHRVRPRRQSGSIGGNLRLEVTPEYLEGSIRYLRGRGYKIVSLDELFEILKGGKINGKIAVFTFDDGYVDNLTYAYPIFKKENAPFTIYITTDCPDRKAVLWWYLLEDVVLRNEHIEIKLNAKPLRYDCSSARNKARAFSHIRSVIMAIREENYMDAIKSIFAPYNIDIFAQTDTKTLSWEQIRYLSRDPLVTIGAHGVSHSALKRLSEKTARYEITGSKEKIEANIGRRIEHFSYPFGSRNEIGKREAVIVRESGFKTAVTSLPGNIFPAHKGHTECLPRAIISGEREGRNLYFLDLWINGLLNCVGNKMKRIVTL